MTTVCPLCKKSQTRLKRHVETIHKTTLNALREFARLPKTPLYQARVVKYPRNVHNVYSGFAQWLKEEGKSGKNIRRYSRCVYNVISKVVEFTVKNLRVFWWERSQPKNLREELCSLYLFLDYLTDKNCITYKEAHDFTKKLKQWSRELLGVSSGSKTRCSA